MRKIRFEIGKYYHIFNRGTDKRIIFLDKKDIKRFFQSMIEFNAIIPAGGIYRNHLKKNELRKVNFKKNRLVSFLCYCLNPNHYHFIVSPLTDKGIEKFMHKIGLGYTNYFNKRYKRSGNLFQGTYKAININSDEYLLHLSAYVNLNNRAHSQLRNQVSQSSWFEYLNNQKDGYCDKSIILNQFAGSEEYKKFAERSLKDIKERKEIAKLLLD